MTTLLEKAQRAYRVFRDESTDGGVGLSDSYITELRNFVPTLSRHISQRVLAPVIVKISMDVSRIPILHVKQDEYGGFEERLTGTPMGSIFGLHANIDQTGAVMIQDLIIKVLEEGSGVLVPINYDKTEKSYIIFDMRVGDVREWYSKSVDIDLYDDSRKQGVVRSVNVKKQDVAIVYNPLYGIMNEVNTATERLINMMLWSDSADQRSVSPNLDMLLQMTYSTKSENLQAEAEARIKELEKQLSNSAYGIGYIGSVEKVIPLNRPVANSLGGSVDRLTKDLYNQLGLTQSIVDGSASEEELSNYYNRTIYPICMSVVDSINKNLITPHDRKSGQAVQIFPDLFKMASISSIAQSADKLSRNAIMSPNEFRKILGIPKSEDDDANELRNRNMPELEPTSD